MKSLISAIIRGLENFVAIPDLLLRLYVAKIFFDAGQTKAISPWIPLPSDTTFLLFEYEYNVPLISSDLAAYLGTFTEIVMPIFLVLGLGGRFAAGILFVFNIVAVIAYPEIDAAGLMQHYAWGLILLYLTLRGPGKLSFDHFIRRKHMPTHLPKP